MANKSEFMISSTSYWRKSDKFISSQKRLGSIEINFFSIYQLDIVSFTRIQTSKRICCCISDLIAINESYRISKLDDGICFKESTESTQVCISSIRNSRLNNLILNSVTRKWMWCYISKLTKIISIYIQSISNVYVLT